MNTKVTKLDFERAGFGIDGNEKWFKRVHELIHVEIDHHGFATLCRQPENKQHTERVVLPRPIRSTDDLDALVLLTTQGG